MPRGNEQGAESHRQWRRRRDTSRARDVPAEPSQAYEEFGRPSAALARGAAWAPPCGPQKTSGADPVGHVPIARDGRYPDWYRWTQDAWAAAVVVDRGLAFEYLAWYTLAITQREFGDKPSLGDLWETAWRLRPSGTCSPVHFKRLRLEPLGAVSISRDAIETKLGKLAAGISAAVIDVSIASYMNVITQNPDSPFHNRRIEHAASLELRQFARALSHASTGSA
jgi:hypothetical protein